MHLLTLHPAVVLRGFVSLGDRCLTLSFLVVLEAYLLHLSSLLIQLSRLPQALPSHITRVLMHN